MPKPLTDFYFHKQQNVFYSRCKVCHCKYKKSDPLKERIKHLSRTFNLTLQEFELLRTAQNNMCAICGKDFSELKDNPCVDHNHNTGKIRGLLCPHCNRGIGLLQDDPTICLKAYNYLV